MTRSITAGLALSLALVAPTSAATWSPRDTTRGVIAAGILAGIGAVVYNNERIHHRADNALRDAPRERRAQRYVDEEEYTVVPRQLKWTCVELDRNRNCVSLKLL